MILELDVGNTSVKWRERHASGALLAQRWAHDFVLSEPSVISSAFERAERIRLSSVSDQQIGAALSKIAERCGIPIEFAKTSHHCAGLSNSYAEPAKMGVDRWLAMLAARQLAGTRPICVLDCGTSLTIDFVSKEGQHEGGLILPGRKLLLTSLAERTEKVLFDPDELAGSLDLGRSTEEAVHNGALHLLAGATLLALKTAGGEARGVYLAGGDGPWLKAGLGFPVEHVPDLVLDGLALALP